MSSSESAGIQTAQQVGVARTTIYGTGFNAHKQLNSETTRDSTTFQPIYHSRSSDVKILFAGWSTTIIVDGPHVVSLGHQRIDQELGSHAKELRSAIGDDDGLRACIDEAGRLYVVEGSPKGTEMLVCRANDSSPRIGHLARASNNRVAMTTKQAPNGNLCHLTEFDSIGSLVRWYQDPSEEENYPASHHMLPGRPRDLKANIANFVMLMADGTIWTWGDARYQSLGRKVSGDCATAANQPGLVGDLSGLKMESIAAGGWQTAAISDADALYIWGAEAPASEHRIRSLAPGEVSLVDIIGNVDRDALDITSVGMGADHIAVVANGALYVAGQNNNGQLGTGGDQTFVEDWQALKLPAAARQVICGPSTTFALLGEAPVSAEQP